MYPAKKLELSEFAKGEPEPAKVQFPPRANPGEAPDWDATLTDVMAKTTKSRALLAK